MSASHNQELPLLPLVEVCDRTGVSHTIAAVVIEHRPDDAEMPFAVLTKPGTQATLPVERERPFRVLGYYPGIATAAHAAAGAFGMELAGMREALERRKQALSEGGEA